MFEVKVFGGFNAAHNLREYKGKCENLHGHNWKVEVSLEAEDLNKLGMVEDFTVIKKKLKLVLKKLDHSHLNEIAYFKKINPTSENIARFIYDGLAKSFKGKRMKVKAVSVWETDTSCATYRKDA
jgi:6-pyruvoyltetrahydropterin/6-carboxytetrahydropterin synthase